ncbi:DUF7009 family protein [Ekhidna sp.]|uniref:DUF7009 family protein n=1 Tax=Ekhidna sp. TaxID=2608089 RepID=UPI003BA8A2B0
MKLRINHSSIRIRLGKQDIQELKEQRQVKNELLFPGGQKLIYQLEIGASFHASLDTNCLILTIPSDESDDWLNSEKLAIETKLSRKGKGELVLLIEKDLHDL